MGSELTKEPEPSKSQSLFFPNKKTNNQYKAFRDDIEKSCKCSYKTRIIGWVVCFAIGWILSLMGSLVFFIRHDMTIFAIFFSLGQCTNIAGSCFLAGPVTQAKDMFKKSRIWFSMAYVLSTIGTLVLALVLPSDLRYIVIITLIIQIISYFFYTLSYIPYGQKLLGKLFRIILE